MMDISIFFINFGHQNTSLLKSCDTFYRIFAIMTFNIKSPKPSAYLWFLTMLFLTAFHTYGVGKSTNNPESKTHSKIWWKTIAMDAGESPDMRITAFDSLSKYQRLTPELLLIKGELLKETGDMVQAADIYSGIIDGDHTGIDAKRMMELKIDYLYMLQSIGRNSVVLRRAHEFLSEPVADSLIHLQAPVRMFMVNGAIVSGRLGIARQYLDDAVEFRKGLVGKSSPEALKYASDQILKGEIMYAIHKGNFEDALHLVDSARSVFSAESKLNFLDMCAPIVYDGMGEKEYAEQLYRKSLEQPNSPDVYISNLNNFANFLIANGKPDEALALINQKVDQPGWMRRHPSYIRLMGIKGEALGKTHDFEEGFRYLLEYRTAMDSIYEAERQDDALLGIEQLKISNKFDSERKHADTLMMMLWIALALVVASTILVFFLLTQRRTLRKRVAHAESELSDIVTRHEKKMEASAEKIEVQQRELVGKELQMAQMSGAIAHMKDLLSDSSIDDSNRLNAMKTELREFSADKDVWEMFRVYFELTHPDFIRNLYEVCPDITQKEIRMCAFVLMNLTTKEIANITRRAPRSVETMKYRLSRKLGLTGGETLYKYLESLGQN